MFKCSRSLSENLALKNVNPLLVGTYAIRSLNT